MSQQYACLFDGLVFSSKEEAVVHMLQAHAEEQENVLDNGLSDVITRLEAEFPGFSFDAAKRPYTPQDNQWALDDDPWFNGKEILSVNFVGAPFELVGMHFAVHDKYKMDHKWQNVFETLDEAVSFYKRFIAGAERFGKAVLAEVSKHVPSAVGYAVTKVEQTYGTADSFNEYHISILHINGKTEPYGYIELDTYDLDSDQSIDKAINQHVKHVSGAFLNQVEGLVTIASPKYCNDHSTWFEVDGVPLHTFASRANTLRIEILEHKTQAEGGDQYE